MDRIPRALLADDDARIGLALGRFLRDGFDVVTVESFDEAVEALRFQQFDVVITDYQMPGRDGGELLAHVKQRYPGIRRVLLTAAPRDERNAGDAELVIEKPWGADIAGRLTAFLRR